MTGLAPAISVSWAAPCWRARESRCVLSTLRHARIAAAPKLARLWLSKGGKPLSNMWLGNPANRRR
ncbi:MAG: hypothetical protein WA756_08930, partial [Pseudolabrys sp.]